MLFAKKFFLSIVALISGIMLFSAAPTNAAPLDRYGGSIVIQTEKNGEAWYVHPLRKKRFYLGKGKRALRVLRSGSVGVDGSVLGKIPRPKHKWTINKDLFDYYGGRIILNPVADGVAWYVHPQTGVRYKIADAKDAKKIINKFGVSITNKALKKIPKGSDRMRYLRYTDKYLKTKTGTFRTRIIAFPRKKVELQTISANTTDCFIGCPAQALKWYVKKKKALAGINGTYFCTTCGIANYSFLSPLFHSSAKKMINAYKLPYHNGPLLVITKKGGYHYFHRSIDFGWTLEEFEERTGKKVAAAIANYPSLVENDRVVIQNESLESSMVTHRLRAGVGYNDRFVYFVTVESATVTDLAYVMKKIGSKYALNMDGGTSTAMMAAGLYKSGPGRVLPNALIIK